MAIPSTRQELVDYCLRELGHPVIEINVDPDQLDDRIDHALQKFREWHFDGVHRSYLKHTLTQTDIDNEYIDVDDAILSVVKLFPASSLLFNSDGIFSHAFINETLGDVYSAGFDLSYYDITKQYLNLIDQTLIGEQSIRFNKHMNRIYLDLDWSKRFSEDDVIIFEVWQIVDPDSYTDVYNDDYLKRYLTALIKKQWGNNLKKYDGVELIGGVKMNGQQIYEEAVEELKELDIELKEVWSMPPRFFIG